MNILPTYIVNLMEKCGYHKSDILIYNNTQILDEMEKEYYPIYKIETNTSFINNIPNIEDMPSDYNKYFEILKYELVQNPTLYKLSDIKTIIMKRNNLGLLQINRNDIGAGKTLVYDYEQAMKQNV